MLLFTFIIYHHSLTHADEGRSIKSGLASPVLPSPSESGGVPLGVPLSFPFKYRFLINRTINKHKKMITSKPRMGRMMARACFWGLRVLKVEGEKRSERRLERFVGELVLDGVVGDDIG